MPKMSCKKDNEWSECSKCQRGFSKKYFARHTDTCSSKETAHWDFSDLESGFIFNRVLFAKPTKNTSPSNGKVKYLERKDIITLHVNTIKALGLHLGSLAILHLKNQQVIRSVWPSSQIPLDSVGVKSSTLEHYKISTGDTVMVHAFSGVKSHANKVELSPCKLLDFDLDTQFLEYCVYHLDDTFVFPGEIVEVPFYGKVKQFIVTKLQTDNGTFSYSTTATYYDISFVTDFQSLNLIEEDYVSYSSLKKDGISKSNVSAASVLSERTPGSLSLESSDISKYYSLLGDSVDIRTNDHDGDEDQSISEYGHMLTSTPAKRNKPTKGFSGTSSFCRHCLEDLTGYYISSAVTTITITQLRVNDPINRCAKETLTYDLVGGLSEQIRVLKEIVALLVKSPDLFKSYGILPPSGVLLYGPSGTGKTLLAKTVASESGIYCITLNGPDVLSRYYGETEAKLRNIFLDAQHNAPSIIFVDELDALCPKRDKVQNEFEKRVVATLLTLMDGLTASPGSGVLVIAATNRPDHLDSALRRPGRFEREIEIGIPRPNERADVLFKLLNKTSHSLSHEELVRFADNAHGYVGADLMAVVKEAAMNALRRNDKFINVNGDNSQDGDHENTSSLISRDDVKEAFRHVRPSGLREVAVDVPKVYWSDIGGNEIVKQKLKQAIEWPLKHPQAFTRMGIDPPKGILMYGPPGCSKTLIAKALATESGLNFIAVKGPEIFSKWVGESEQAIRQVFHKARTAAPCVVFFDEIDAIASKRGSCEGEGSNVSERVLTQLLTELDGVDTLNDVTLVAATNRPDVIDKALMRPGRIDRIIYIPLPDCKTRSEIFTIQLRNTPLASDVNISDIVAKTEGYSGAEITAICREAALAALQEDINAASVRHEHFSQALKTVKPRISSDLVHYYATFQEHCGLHSL